MESTDMTIAEGRLLLLMRHAKSDWGSGATRDFDRPLTDRGERDARKVGKWLAAQQIAVDAIVSSPAVRARLTAALVAGELDLDEGRIELEQRLYEATLADLLAVIGMYSASHRTILLIGHNPGFDALLSHLARDEPERTSSGKLMTTSALAILEFGEGPVSMQPHTARLKKLIRPKQL
jgi:phosphohistidine phosphatase